MKAAERKNIVFPFRLTREQHRRLKAASAIEKKKPTEFVRDSVLKEIGRVETAA
jgi:uncharacterized protein (DUF1778 family)